MASLDLKKYKGNILGGPRAEVDRKMLKNAFVETADFQALVTTTDFNFVVGRRGTGKSVLFEKVSEYIKKNKLGYVFCDKPSEYDALNLYEELIKISEDYKTIRAITRVAWRVSILLQLLHDIKKHYKFDKLDEKEPLLTFYSNFEEFLNLDTFEAACEIIKKFSDENIPKNMIPGRIAKYFQIESLNNSIRNALESQNRVVYFLFDGLDEGWKPDAICTGIVGGLSSCASDFLEKESGIHMILFIRDNIFRSINYFDQDFSRHIEGNTLRLNWDNFSLLHLVGNRLRVALNLGLQSDVKVWNRFVDKSLQNKTGFDTCLNYTLYRPRDLIVLLNTSFVQATRGGRNRLTKTDIENSSKQISKNRLDDLLKEYDEVFPGLALFIDELKGSLAFQKFSMLIETLDQIIVENDYSRKDASDFAILETGNDSFYALYSIGFLGIENETTKILQFCHDGSQADIDIINPEQVICVHPCYWKALDLRSEIIEEEVLIEVYDDQEQKSQTVDGLRDIRTKRIGQLISQLPAMEEGKEKANEFENWVFRTIKILFSGILTNPELKPNKDAIQRRDIVATNMAEKGFWKRVLEDFKSRQVIFEVKNYSTLKIEDFRQALSYTSEKYGSFVIIVNRNSNEGLSAKEKGYVKEFWDEHKVMILILPAPLISRCISKLRSRQRFDYADKFLNKRLDVFQRSYLSLNHAPKKRKEKI